MRVVSALAMISARVVYASDCTVTSLGFLPLNDLGTGFYLGQFQGGLYPSGSNAVPSHHLAAGLAAAGKIVPRDLTGTPSPTGKIVFISVGMSNTALEFCGGDGRRCSPESFVGQAKASAAVNRATLRIVNGAKGAEPAPNWLDPGGENYVRLARVLAQQGLAEAQVQIAWVKQANPLPTTPLPAAEADAYVLEAELGTIVRALKTRYPNLEQVFLSSRIYGGYATSDLNPEPYAYESGFAVKWLIEAQIQQMATPGKPADPIAGDLDYETVAPWIAWGPYLWADGTTPRSDGLAYPCSDLTNDGTHPASGAIEKVVGLLLNFFLGSSVTAPWFASGSTPTSTSTSSSTSTSTSTSSSTTSSTTSSSTSTSTSPSTTSSTTSSSTSISTSTSTSIPTSTTTTVPSCPSEPAAGCRAAASGDARVSFHRRTNVERDTFQWQWSSPAATPTADFGNPLAATSYRLCMYDAGGLALEVSIPAGASCEGAPCWKPQRSGFRYRDPQRGRAGLGKIWLTGSKEGHTRLSVTGKGANLPLPPMPVAVPLRLQLAPSGSGPCWDATFAVPKRNDTKQFRARAGD